MNQEGYGPGERGGELKLLCLNIFKISWAKCFGQKYSGEKF